MERERRGEDIERGDVEAAADVERETAGGGATGGVEGTSEETDRAAGEETPVEEDDAPAGG